MHDPRIDELSKQLVGYSTEVKKGDRVLIDLFDVPDEVGISLIREVRSAGAIPFANIHRAKVTREMYRDADEAQFDSIADCGIH